MTSVSTEKIKSLKKGLAHVFELAHKYVKGVVDKIFEAVDNFHGHIRIQHGQLP